MGVLRGMSECIPEPRAALLVIIRSTVHILLLVSCHMAAQHLPSSSSFGVCITIIIYYYHHLSILILSS